MHIRICAVGKMKAGPEKTLVDDYLTRFNRIGRNFGFGPIDLKEVEDRKGGGATAEAMLLARAIPDNSLVCILDERGQTCSSPQFSKQLSNWRDKGIEGVSFIIGGADGIDPDFRGRSDMGISLGKMVWPHMLARVMLSEQLYRAVTIIAGSPYHRS